MQYFVVAIFLAPPKNNLKNDFNLKKVFENRLEKLQFPFTNQTDRFWKISKGRGLAHLRSKDPSQPLMLLLAASPAAHECVDYLAIEPAEMLHLRHKRTLAITDGEKERENPPEETKMTMDNFLKKKIGALHRVMFIHHLQFLPPLLL